MKSTKSFPGFRGGENMKVAKLFMGLLAISLLLVPGLAHAQSAPNADAEGRLRGFEGEVVNGAGVLGDEGELTIKDPRTGEERVIHLTSSNGQPTFSIKTPGNSELSDIPSSVKPGAGVAVLARQVGGQWMAVEVLVKPEEPTAPPRIGVVMASNSEEGTVTILTSSGIARTLQLAEGTLAPADGDLVIAFAEPNYGANASAGLERVTGLTRASEVRDRLESHLESVTSDQNVLNGAEPAVKANHAQSLTELLDRQTTRHFERLEKALGHTTIGNQRSVIGALVKTGNARQLGRGRAAQLRDSKANDGSQSVDSKEKVKDNQGQGEGQGQGEDEGNRNPIVDNSDNSDNSNDRGNSDNSSAGGNNADNSNAGGNSDKGNDRGNSGNSSAGGNSG